jgi:hypothetical protein
MARWEIHTAFQSERLKGIDNSEDLGVAGEIMLERNFGK